MADCVKPALVGLGTPPAWLCQQHFEAELKRTSGWVKACSAGWPVTS